MRKTLALILAALMMLSIAPGVFATVKIDNGSTDTRDITLSTIEDALNGPGMSLSYTNDTQNAWISDNMTFTERNVGATTIQGMSNTSTTLSTTVELAANEFFTFDWFVSSESSYLYTENENHTGAWYDYVTFKANGEFVFKAKGNDTAVAPLDAMETYIFRPTEAGTYTFEWTYQKDGSVDGGLDAFFLDNCMISIPGPATEISVSPTEVEIMDTQTAQLTATVLPTIADDLTVTWSSSDESVATVNENGLVYGVAPGTATIIVTSNSNPALSATATITVLSSAEEHQVLRDALNVEGGSLPFFNDAAYPWAIDNSSFSGRSAGKSTIEGMHSTRTSITLTVQAEQGKHLMFDWFASSESVSFDYLAFYVNDDMIAKIGGEAMTDFERYSYEIPEDGTYTFRWTYSKDSSDDGGLDAAWLDEVEISDIPALESIVIDPANILVPVGGTKTVTVTPVPSVAMLSEITWTTSDASVATVEDGVITGVALGTATITATSAEGFTATVDVEVATERYAYGYSVYDTISGVGISEFALVSNTATFLGEFEVKPYAMEYINGTLYAYAAETDYYGTIIATYFIVADADTLEYSIIDVDVSNLMYDMAYDHSTGTLYGLGTYDSGRGVFTINTYTGTASLVAPLTGNTNDILTLACSTDGQLYGVEITSGTLCAIDKETGECTAIGATGISPIYIQSMAWDHNNDILIWAAYSHAADGIYAVDTTTGAASVLYPNTGEICGLYVEYEGTPLPDQVFVTGVTVEPTTVELGLDESVHLTATVFPEDASDKRIIWSSSDETIARVTSTGFVIARGEGTAVITATTADGGFTATCTVTCTGAEMSNYVYVRTDEILPDEVYVIGAVDAYGDFYIMTTEFGVSEGNVQLKGTPAVLGTYEGQEAVIEGATISEEWLFETSGHGITIRNMDNLGYANTVDWNGYYWLSLTDTSDMYWTWDSANQFFVASNAATLGDYSNLAYGNSLEDPMSPNAFDIFAPQQNYFGLQLYVRQEIGDIPEVTYTVTFYDWDGTELAVETVNSGSDATPPADPSREGYIFLGWEGNYTNVTSDESVYAVYRLIGDANGDDSLNTGDAAYILRYVVDLVDMTTEDLLVSDVNSDSIVNTGDAAALLSLLIMY